MAFMESKANSFAPSEYIVFFTMAKKPFKFYKETFYDFVASTLMENPFGPFGTAARSLIFCTLFPRLYYLSFHI